MGYQPPYGYPPPYGYQAYPPQMMPMNPMLPPNEDSYYSSSNPGVIFEEEDFDKTPDFPDFNENDDSEWGVVSEKCKVVSGDGITIKNCTDSNKNPYAGTPVRNNQRIQRQAPMPYYPMPQQMLAAPVYYVMPQPMYQPTYYPPPSQQRSNDYYEVPDESQIYLENKKFQKKHQVIQEDDY